jgi:hypothetical protein
METTKSIEGNKLIAEFMDWYQLDLPKNGDINWVHNSISAKLTDKILLPRRLDDMKFNSSWDWLMPVVEKISRMKIGDGIETVEYAYPRTFGMVNKGTGGIMVRLTGFTLHEAETLIEATYLAVVEFLTWLKENPKAGEV